MKAPDKIYLPPIEQWLGTKKGWGKKTENDIEYIRKDALVKWAKQRRERIAKEVVIQEGVRLGADAAFEELIDKLNSL